MTVRVTDELRQKIADIFADAFESGANGGGGSFAEEEYTARILRVLEPQGDIDREKVEFAIISEIARQTSHKWPVPVDRTVALIDAEIDLQQVADAAIAAIGEQE